MNPYETDKLLSEYLLFHYGDKETIFGSLPGPTEALNFAGRLVGDLIDPSLIPDQAAALEIGCAVGRSAFELTRYVNRVQALDYSHRFVGAANELKAQHHINTQIAVEGAVTASFTARIPQGLRPENVDFFQGDATDLPAHLKDFDVVLAANLICRLPEPMKFLQRLPALVKSGGQLLLTTPLTWLEEFTPKPQWIGARENGRRSFDALQDILKPDFELAAQRDIPFVIREHARKFQYSVALGTRWLRR